MKSLIIIVILVLININISLQLSGSLPNLFKPEDFSTSTKWVLSRNRAIGYKWQEEDHKDNIDSIAINDNKEWIVTCSNSDHLARFHRILMYPNLYPDWSHLYYGSLRLRGYNETNSNIINQKCLFDPVSNRLISLSTDKVNSKLIIDIYSPIYYKNVENRLPIYKDSPYKHDINYYQNETGFNIAFPIDNYNEIWRFNTSIEFKSKDKNLIKNSDIILSMESEYLIVSTNTEIGIVELGDNDFRKSILNTTSISIRDVTMLSNNHLVILTEQSKLIVFKRTTHIDKKGNWIIKKKLDTPLPNIIQISSNLESYHRNDKEQCTGINDKPVDLLVLIDSSKTVHVVNVILSETTTTTTADFVDDENDNTFYLKLVRSFPVIDTEVINPNSNNLKTLVKFSRINSQFLVIQYPMSSILYIYQREQPPRLDYLIHSAIELPNGRGSLDIGMFNLKYNYVLVQDKGHLLSYRELKSTVKPCDNSSRTKSFYLPAPPIYNHNIEGNNNDIERYGIFESKWFYLIILFFLGMYKLIKPLISFENFIIGKLNSKISNETIEKLSKYLFYLASTIIFILSIFEIIFQSAFTNDWPAHIMQVQQWKNPPPFSYDNTTAISSLLRRTGLDFDYSHYMHYHGPCTYPGGFLLLYGALSFVTREYSLQIYQFIWAVMEFSNFMLLYWICKRLKVPIIMSLLPVLSNRLHLYNVRVVINDFPNIFLLHICMILLIKKRYLMFSVLYSFIVTLKLNIIFYSPAILFIFLNDLKSYNSIIVKLAVMAGIQLLVGLPYLLTNYKAYISTAYDFSRTLLWEKTRNFKFVGRVIYDSSFFNLTLLLLMIIGILVILIRLQLLLTKLKIFLSKSSASNNGNKDTIELDKNRIFILSFIVVNFMAITFGRGLYTPFLCWYFYTLPILMYLGGFPITIIVLSWLSHEILFRFFNDLATEMFATFIYFMVNLMIVLKVSINTTINNTNLISSFSNERLKEIKKNQ